MPEEPVTVSLESLNDNTVPFETLEEAFGPSSLGILIVKDLPVKFAEIRNRVLSYASYLANLPPEELDRLTLSSAAYLTGWSHGKEALKLGTYDTLKGSYYVNCAFYQDPSLQSASEDIYKDFPEYTHPNIWPSEKLLPGFRTAFEELCTLIIDTGVLVAKACDRYALAKIEGYENGYLERVVKTSTTTKARLLHYFPPKVPQQAAGQTDNEIIERDVNDDSWCATHIDHGCLTGLTSALYVDEEAESPVPSKREDGGFTLPTLTSLSSAPSPDAGLYIKSRTSTVTKVNIPPSCLAFQTGEALQLITAGKFRAVPHFVKAGTGTDMTNMARNTLAVFTQPNLGEIVDREQGLTFADFAKDVSRRFGQGAIPTLESSIQRSL